MGLNDGFFYSPLTTHTQTRVIVLAPGKGDDPIHCFHLTIDLNADWKLHGGDGHSSPSQGTERMCYMEAKTKDGKLFQRFTAPALRFHPEKNNGLYPFQRYMALSYVWGDQSNPHEIFLNGEQFYVGHTLHIALKRLRRHAVVLALTPTPQPDATLKDGEDTAYHMLPEGRVLWVDAMCINQADIAEREAQVKLMARIYKQADHVHADLGDTGEAGGLGLLRLFGAIIKAGEACDSRQLCSPSSQPQRHMSNSQQDAQIMSAIASEFDNYEHKRSDTQLVDLPRPATESLEDHGIPPRDDPIWAQWRLFLSSPYFQRLWIVQEFTLAKTITLSFADISVEPRMVSSCIGLLSKYSTDRGLYYFSNNSSEAVAQDTTSLARFASLTVQRRQLHGSNGLSEERSRLLDNLRHARDAAVTDSRDKIYGMLGLSSDGPDFYHLVSYSRSVEVVYQDFARSLVEKGQGIELLYQIDSRITRTLNIPTWVPDWSRSIDESSITLVESHARSHASGTAKFPAMQCLDSKLLVDGVLIDTVGHMSTSLRNRFLKTMDADIIRFLWEGGHLLVEKEPPVQGTVAMELVFNTLLCGCHGSKSPMEIDRLRRSMWAVFGHGMSVAAGRGEHHSAWLPHMRDFLQTGLLNAIGRSWCITEGGNFGLVPGGAKRGDRIAMLRGGPFPFIIRPLSEAEDTEYALVGHGYLHNPRRMEDFNDEGSEYRRIVLV